MQNKNSQNRSSAKHKSAICKGNSKANPVFQNYLQFVYNILINCSSNGESFALNTKAKECEKNVSNNWVIDSGASSHVTNNLDL
ncbi:hypothetical protein JGG67_23045, partial [Salmonella enterica subsp. enterica serovar Derby]|nr:hypothetical protein [Salmonella enterica subsp. enterica serovar Derby]